MKHDSKVMCMIRNEPDLLKIILQAADEEHRTGPKTPPYAEGKHKSIVYLSGTNVVLLKKMVRDEKKADCNTKVTRSVIINHMIEYYLENHTTKESRKIIKPT